MLVVLCLGAVRVPAAEQSDYVKFCGAAPKKKCKPAASQWGCCPADSLHGKRCCIVMNHRGGDNWQAVDEFEKWGMQDRIETISFKLPPSQAIVLFNGRFFKDSNGDLSPISHWLASNGTTLAAAALAGTTMVVVWATNVIADMRNTQAALYLRGTGKDETVKLSGLKKHPWDFGQRAESAIVTKASLGN
jgi:hypothetical protein